MSGSMRDQSFGSYSRSASWMTTTSPQTGPYRSALAPVALVIKNGERNRGVIPWPIGGQFELTAGTERQTSPAPLCAAEIFSQPIRRAVARSVVDNDDLLGDLGQRVGDFDQDSADSADFVVYWDDDR
jgi:hypothetical protein